MLHVDAPESALVSSNRAGYHSANLAVPAAVPEQIFGGLLSLGLEDKILSPIFCSAGCSVAVSQWQTFPSVLVFYFSTPALQTGSMY